MPNVIVPALGQFGLIADQPPQEVPVNGWTDCLNVRFRGGCLERVAGHRQVFTTPSVTPMFVYPYQSLGKRYWVHCSASAVYVDDGTTRTDITGPALTGTTADRWTGCVLNGILVLNNGVDSPMYWNGDTGTNLAVLPGWTAGWTARSIVAFKFFLVAIGFNDGTTDYPHLLKWSTEAEPGSVPTSWDNTDPTKLAEERDIAETTDTVVDGLVLGDGLLIYKEQSIYAARFVGGTYVFETRRVPGGDGMLTKGCACVTPRGHLVLGNGDLMLVDGINEPQSIVADRLRDWLFRTQIDTTQYSKCFVVANPSLNEAWVCYPATGQEYCTRALIWNWESNTFGLRELPNVNHASSGLLEYTAGNSWDADSDSWDSDDTAWNQDEFGPTEPRLIMASNDGKLFLADSGTTFDGTAISAFAEHEGMAFDAPDGYKLIKSVIPRVDASTGTVLSIKAGGAANAEVAPSYSTPASYTVGTTYKADLFASGRFLSLHISSSGGGRWRIKSITLDVQPMGMY